MGKNKTPAKRVSGRRIVDISSPRLKKLKDLGTTHNRMKIVKKLRKSVRVKHISKTLVNSLTEEKLKKIVLKLLGDETIEEIDGFVKEWEYFQDIDLIILGSSNDEYKEYTDLLREEYSTMDLDNYHSMRSKEDTSDSTETSNTPMKVAGTITSKLSDPSGTSNSYDDDDCVIVDITPASIICLDDGESEINLMGSNTANNITINNKLCNNKIQNPSLDSISSICDSIFNSENTNSLFVIDPKPGYNGSKIPLYHSIATCAQSTPIRNVCDTDQSIITQSNDLVNNITIVTPKNFERNRSDSDVILIQDEVISVRKTPDTIVDESVIFCGTQMVRTPIRRIETTTPSPNQTRILRPAKRNRIGRIRNRNKTKTNQSGSNADTIIETFQKSLNSSSVGDKRIVIIDGCNIAFGHGNNKKFSAEGIEIALKYFERKGHETKIVVPQFRLRIQQSTNQALMHRLQNTDKLVVTPSKNLPGKMSSSYDDRFILQLAEEFDAAIISNDNYRDLLLENPAWKKIIETRVIGYTWLKDFFMVPTDPYGKTGPTLDDILNKNV